MEEFEESDMSYLPIAASRRTSSTQTAKKSDPIDIPRNMKRPWKIEFNSCSHKQSCAALHVNNEEDADEEEEYGVLPHVLVSRRMTAPGKMEFSVRTGQGRKLKGRDLSRVRDSILRMTGFIES
ncbi:hypothetical protein QJS10_CPB20g01749 [Acorus calamus]|uniref:Senescence regulator n=1 Tax=Acorus calamus TaxID=4465 RepID=A0AAV9C9G0_ACOCL|nr:hypothetical protein QJS10_CPB20g01749 [Acorus calamus]